MNQSCYLKNLRSSSQLLTCALIALIVLTLAGCAGKPQKRGGAYYKDDGPASNIPANLDRIPDAQPRLEPLRRAANRPYVVLGKSYVPNTTLKPMRQRGIASWYGKKFHGHKTSIGEPYDMFAMTAAHPTLALPSYVRVTHLGNGKSVVVRVIDRGPFHAGRIIDLSYAAAHRLGYVNQGSAQVEVEALIPGAAPLPPVETRISAPAPAPASAPTPAPVPVYVPPMRPPAPEFDRLMARLSLPSKEDEVNDENTLNDVSDANGTNGTSGTTGTTGTHDTNIETPALASDPVSPSGQSLFLQLGAFSSADNAEGLRIYLSRELDWLTDPIRVQGGGGVYRVQLGPYAKRADAEKTAEKISAALGYRPSFILR